MTENRMGLRKPLKSQLLVEKKKKHLMLINMKTSFKMLSESQKLIYILINIHVFFLNEVNFKINVFLLPTSF